MKMTGNTILITGGTSGIGRALAEALDDRGNRVIVTGRRQPLLDAITADRPGITGIACDIDDPAGPAQLAKAVLAQFPELNVVLANAGILPAEDLTIDAWDLATAEATIQTNILGVLRTAAAFVPAITGKPDAAFIATSSNLASIPITSAPTYCATKAFVHSWLQSLRHQLRRTGLEVLELAPPYVQTELTGAHQASDPHAMPLDEYVAEVLHLLEMHDHPGGEILVERARAVRHAERDGTYDTLFAAMNRD